MLKCSQPKCRIAETGQCLDGHKTGCPNIVHDGPVAVTQAKAPEDGVLVATGIASRRFHNGEKLDLADASTLLRNRPARVVLCAGAEESGKTTFLARLGEMLRDGAFEGYWFAGSQTLCAFERATWLATVASGVGRRDTPRTRRPENDTFYHFSVCRAGDTYVKHDLLVSDLAGETFPTAVASDVVCRELHALGRADHLVLFLDCERLANRANRHPERDNAKSFLKRAIGVRSAAKSLHVHVVFSRWDKILDSPDRSKHEKHCEDICVDWSASFDTAVATLSFWRIAARPAQGRPTDADIQAMVRNWIETPLNAPKIRVAHTETTSRPARDFSAFGFS